MVCSNINLNIIKNRSKEHINHCRRLNLVHEEFYRYYYLEENPEKLIPLFVNFRDMLPELYDILDFVMYDEKYTNRLDDITNHLQYIYPSERNYHIRQKDDIEYNGCTEYYEKLYDFYFEEIIYTLFHRMDDYEREIAILKINLAVIDWDEFLSRNYEF